jgi:tRNA(Ile)-lysidine synthase
LKWEKQRFKVIREMEDCIRRYSMLEPGQTVLVAVSGGRDSLVLLDALVNLAPGLGIELRVVHVDHGLRKESPEDAGFVSRVADFYKLPAAIHKVNISRKRGGRALSPEEAAREARYEVFDRELAGSGAQRLATGHTADDRVETFLLRLLAGAGPAGLTSIAPARFPYIRPLIDTWRSDIDSYLPFLPFEPREDRSNFDTSVPRNRVRHRLLPLLEAEYNPSARKVFLREAKLLESFQEMVMATIEEARQADVSKSGEGFLVDIESIKRRPAGVQRQLILDILVALGVEPGFDAVEDIRHRLIYGRENPTLDLSAGVTARKQYGTLFLGKRRNPEEPRDLEWKLPAEGLYHLQELSIVLRISPIRLPDRDPSHLSGATRILVDADKLLFPLTLRHPGPGDRFSPLGMKGSKKVQDFLVDIKLPAADRGKVLVLESEGRIVWLAGLRMDERFKIDEKTSRVMEIELKTG